MRNATDPVLVDKSFDIGIVQSSLGRFHRDHLTLFLPKRYVHAEMCFTTIQNVLVVFITNGVRLLAETFVRNFGILFPIVVNCAVGLRSDPNINYNFSYMLVNRVGYLAALNSRRSFQ